MQFIDSGAMIPIVAILASLGFGFIWLRYHELKLQSRLLERNALEQSEGKHALQSRLAVLERIVTDRGLETADAIDALRGPNHKEAR